MLDTLAEWSLWCVKLKLKLKLVFNRTPSHYQTRVVRGRMTGHRLRADTPTGQCYPSGAYKLAEIYGNLDRKRLDKLLN